MNEKQIEILRNHILVCALTRDHADIWLLNGEGTDPALSIHRIQEQHRHVVTAQEHHGHDTEIGEVSYFVEVARALALGSNVMMLGHGDGKANYMKKFMGHISTHNVDLFKKVVAEENLNLPHMTPAQVVAQARHMWKSVV